MNDEKVSIPKEKSTMYPAYTVNEIIEDFIKIINQLGGKKVSIDLVAKTLEVSPTTKSFTRKISAAKQYNLIETSQGSLELTDLAKKILYPTDDKINSLKIQAFSSPNIYAKLIERYEDKALPNSGILSNILLEPEYGITRNVKDLVVEKFIENCNDLDIIKSGILTMNNENDVCSSPNDEIETINTPSTSPKAVSSVGYQEMAIPLAGKMETIKILIPNTCDKDDYEFLKQYIELVLPMYINRMEK